MSIANNLAYVGEVVLRSFFLVCSSMSSCNSGKSTYGVLGTPTIGGYTYRR